MIPIPKLMRTLERDRRGYPVPWIIQRDRHGKPIFTINDQELVADCMTKRLCSICGRSLRGGFWFVGGSRAFLHERGAFLDPPVHYECGEFALQICPYLAARKFTDRTLIERLTDRQLADLPDGIKLMDHPAQYPGLPERFGFGFALGYEIGGALRQLMSVQDWRYLEWWRAGERINAPDTGEPPP